MFNNFENYRIHTPGLNVDNVLNLLNIIPNHTDLTNIDRINIESQNLSNFRESIENITTPNLEHSNNSTLRRIDSLDDLFRHLNTWINLISTNNSNIDVNYYSEEPDPVTVNMSTELFSKMIKDLKYTSNIAEKQCAICTENFQENEHIKCTPCNHLFHMNCIYEWLTKKCTHPCCPVCRHDCRESYIS
jgi:hypothetical protein